MCMRTDGSGRRWQGLAFARLLEHIVTGRAADGTEAVELTVEDLRDPERGEFDAMLPPPPPSRPSPLRPPSPSPPPHPLRERMWQCGSRVPSPPAVHPLEIDEELADYLEEVLARRPLPPIATRASARINASTSQI